MITAEERRFRDNFTTLDSIEEQELKWLVPNWIPEGAITLLDNSSWSGVEKAAVLCNIIAALSRGTSCILDPEGYTREPKPVAFISTEDSVSMFWKARLIKAGADTKKIVVPKTSLEARMNLDGLKLGSRQMERFVESAKPSLLVIDPIQGSLPANVNMASRNAMRDCLFQLIALGEKTGTAFLVVASSLHEGENELWDIARSVIAIRWSGYMEDNRPTLTNPKNNYSESQKAVRFSIDENGRCEKIE